MHEVVLVLFEPAVGIDDLPDHFDDPDLLILGVVPVDEPGEPPEVDALFELFAGGFHDGRGLVRFEPEVMLEDGDDEPSLCFGELPVDMRHLEQERAGGHGHAVLLPLFIFGPRAAGRAGAQYALYEIDHQLTPPQRRITEKPWKEKGGDLRGCIGKAPVVQVLENCSTRFDITREPQKGEHHENDPARRHRNSSIYRHA